MNIPLTQIKIKSENFINLQKNLKNITLKSLYLVQE